MTDPRPWRGAGDAPMTDRDDLRAAVEALADEHRRWGGTFPRCKGCGREWPCLPHRVADAWLAEHPAPEPPGVTLRPFTDPPVWCSEHMEPYCPRHTEPPSDEAAMHIDPEPPNDAKGCRHIELPDTLWKRLREAEEKAEEEYRRGFDEGVRRLDLLRREQATPEPPSDLRSRLSSRVKAGLALKGWTQADLAFAAGLSEKHLSQMLTGRVDGALSMWQHLLETVGPAPEPTSGGKVTAAETMRPGRLWRVLAADGSVWCETSNEAEARVRQRPGDTLQRLWRAAPITEWRDA